MQGEGRERGDWGKGFVGGRGFWVKNGFGGNFI